MVAPLPCYCYSTAHDLIWRSELGENRDNSYPPDPIMEVASALPSSHAFAPKLAYINDTTDLGQQLSGSICNITYCKDTIKELQTAASQQLYMENPWSLHQQSPPIIPTLPIKQIADSELISSASVQPSAQKTSDKKGATHSNATEIAHESSRHNTNASLLQHGILLKIPMHKSLAIGTYRKICRSKQAMDCYGRSISTLRPHPLRSQF